ncbi:MAG: magnesium transporter CorA family protein [Minisyncoccia bacterium]
MINTYKYNSETWIDIDRGTTEEIHEMMNKYNIHPFVAKELNSENPKPRIEFHDQYIYCILHFPVRKHTHVEGKSQEVDFIIGKDTIITARYDTIDALHKFAKDIEVDEILDKNGDRKHKHTHFIFINMLRDLYASLFEELESIEDTTEEITSQIFHGKEKEMVISISEVTRTLLDFKRITDLHYEILESLRHRGEEIFGSNFGYEVETIIIDYLKINTTIKSNLEVLHELRDTNNSLLTSKQNETVKNLTVVGSIVLPLNLIAVIFAMRTEGMPIIKDSNAFWVVICIMLISALISISYAKHKKWL